MTSPILRALRRFRRSESGGATIEFIIFVPIYLVLFVSTFELGMLMSRQVMLDRALDLTVRQVRLGQVFPVNHANIRAALCDNALLIPNCESEVKLEMVVIDPRSGGSISGEADCIDREDASVPVRQFNAGVANQLMFLRACALYDPFAPTTGLGSILERQSGDAYALVSTSSYVVEP